MGAMAQNTQADSIGSITLCWVQVNVKHWGRSA